jgi:hypothetical protein
VKLSVQACDLGLTGGRFGACTLDTQADCHAPPLARGQRAARAIAGGGFLALAVPMLSRRLNSVGVVAGWFGITHLLAAATRFGGCPELGVVPSLLLHRQVATECGPWEWVDEQLGLTNAPN